MDFAELQAKAGRIAHDHGWDDKPVDFGMSIALIHSEVSEALEHYRSGHDIKEIFLDDEKGIRDEGGILRPKPDGIPIELADIMIRVWHLAYVEGIDLEHAINLKMRYNELRPMRHGGLKA
jgi:NTP pyrophosphatase (non-canonical NTP hydrolase)